MKDPPLPSDLKVGDRVPLPKRKLDIRPAKPDGKVDNRSSFKPARKK